MPTFALPAEKGEVYYELQPPVLDRSKPTLVVYPPSWCDSSIVVQYLEDAPEQQDELKKRFNLLAVDMRSHGRTTLEPFKGIDGYVQAVDLALLLDHLNLTSVHLAASVITPSYTILAFALLFPQHTLSLSFFGVPLMYDTPEKAGIDAIYLDVIESLVQNDDPEVYLDAMAEMSFFAFGGVLEEDRVDNQINMVIRRFSPFHAIRLFESIAPLVGATNFTPELIQRIECPVLAISGRAGVATPAEIVGDFFQDFSSSKDRRLHLVEEAPNYVYLTHAAQTVDQLLTFLDPHLASPPAPARAFDFPGALSTLTTLFPDAPAAHGTDLDPRDARNYSLIDPEDPVREELWELCNEIDGKGFELLASSTKETWEEGGHLHDPRDGWRFTQRDFYYAPRRPSLPLSDLHSAGASEYGLDVSADGEHAFGAFALATEDGASTVVTTTTTEAAEGQSPGARSDWGVNGFDDDYKFGVSQVVEEMHAVRLA
ncbi:hypothetical protein JCM10207_002760 [Rhodosporidiobolus poonsookiae]